MISWELAERVAAGLGGAGESSLPGDLTRLSEAAEREVLAYSALTPLAPLPSPQVVGRDTWARANVRLLRATLAPLDERLDVQAPGAVRAVAGGVVAAEMGALVGYLSRRVLGQYEVALTTEELDAAPQLYLVAPNLQELAARMELQLADLLAWVTVHELTHAVQFASVPWLRPHLGGLVGELLRSTEVRLDIGALRAPTLDDARALWERARQGGLVGLVTGGAQAELLAQMQATMALVEGHAEHVMDAAGAPLVPSLARLRTALDRRRAERSPLASLLERLLGLDMKLRQYTDGKRFCDAVVAREGVAALNRAWSAPERLPTAAELADPGAWLRRTRPRALPAAS